jgi:hypothetical protein
VTRSHLAVADTKTTVTITTVEHTVRICIHEQQAAAALLNVYTIVAHRNQTHTYRYAAVAAVFYMAYYLDLCHTFTESVLNTRSTQI